MPLRLLRPELSVDDKRLGAWHHRRHAGGWFASRSHLVGPMICEFEGRMEHVSLVSFLNPCYDYMVVIIHVINRQKSLPTILNHATNQLIARCWGPWLSAIKPTRSTRVVTHQLILSCGFYSEFSGHPRALPYRQLLPTGGNHMHPYSYVTIDH